MTEPISFKFGGAEVTTFTGEKPDAYHFKDETGKEKYYINFKNGGHAEYYKQNNPKAQITEWSGNVYGNETEENISCHNMDGVKLEGTAWIKDAMALHDCTNSTIDVSQERIYSWDDKETPKDHVALMEHNKGEKNNTAIMNKGDHLYLSGDARENAKSTECTSTHLEFHEKRVE